MHPTLEVLFLVIPARSPGQDAGDVQIFTQRLAPHVRRLDALVGTLVMAASGGVDMVVGAVPAQSRQMRPALQTKFEVLLLDTGTNADSLVLNQVLRTAADTKFVFARRQEDMLPVSTVDLRMEVEIGIFSAGEPPRRQRIDAHQTADGGRRVADAPGPVPTDASAPAPTGSPRATDSTPDLRSPVRCRR